MNKTKKILLCILAVSLVILGGVAFAVWGATKDTEMLAQNTAAESEIDFDDLIESENTVALTEQSTQIETSTEEISSEEVNTEETVDEEATTESVESDKSTEEATEIENSKKEENQVEVQTEAVVIVKNDEAKVEEKTEEKSKEAEDTLAGIEENKTEAPKKKYVVCIDPGHFLDSTILEGEVPGENFYGYQEGIMTLKIALALKNELAKYGIDAYMTRNSDHIAIGGYADKDLDKGHISLRGEFAKGADLFVSLHTNSNGENANGVDTYQQPKEINKTIVIVNQVAYNSDVMLNVANNIGAALSNVSYSRGLAFTNQFNAVTRKTIKEWNSAYNDGLNQVGTVCYRWGTKGDYYGVLRGASNVGAPGMIIEHGFHSYPEMRRQGMMEDLANAWAQADALGIAKGLGVIQ